jgi:putative phage-type endonuclease
MEQRSPEWFAARAGKVTASRIADMMARTKTGWGAGRVNYLAELVAERLTGVSQSGYVNGAMQRGVEMEPEAITAYEFDSDNTVTPIGFVEHPTIPMAGASPDGHIADDGSVEVKCPNTSTHIDTLLGGSVPGKYILQIQWQLACSGRAWCDFVSYDSRMPEELKLFVRRVDRDEAKIAELETAVIEFLSEVDAKVAQLNALMQGVTPLTSALESSLASLAVEGA